MKKNIAHTTIIAALTAVLAPAILAATPEMPKPKTVAELMPTEPFPSTYAGFEHQKSRFPAQLEGSGEFVVTRVAGICPGPTAPHLMASFPNSAMEVEHFTRIGNSAIADEMEKRYIEWEMCEAATIGQKVKVVRLQIISMGCVLPFEDPKKPSRNPVVQHACFYMPIVEYKGKEQAIASNALEGFEAFAVERLNVYLNN